MKCVPCPTSDQCTKCITGDRSAPAKCVSCVEGYFISSDQCVACAVSNCKWCPLGSVCDDCNDYYFNSRVNLCSQCGFMCEKCLNNATCEQCSAGYTAKNPGLLTCDECPDNCEICTTEQTLIGGCTKCYTGYTLDLSSSSCVPCTEIDNCAACRSADGMLTCTTCQPGYLLVGNICHDCGGCTTCTWNETAGRIQCQCPTVTDNPDISIDDPYAFWGCCPSGDYACQPGYLYLGPVDSSGASLCVACIDGCRYCNSTTGCIQCNPDRNYAVEPKEGDATCISCTMTFEACISCSGKLQIFQCDECAAGYYLEDFNCEACPTNCANCTNSTSCVICTNGAVKGTDGLCYACSENCQNCTLDDESGATFCTLCSDNYTEKNGKCEACPNHCHTCTEIADVLVCTSCQQHYTTNDHVCAACPVNCETCRANGVNMVCHICKDEFYLDPENTCQKCIYGCLKCLDGTSCYMCRPGRGLSADKRSCIGCQFLTDVLNCASCTDSTVNSKAKCTYCMTGYTLSDDATQCFSIYSFGRQCTDASDQPPSCTKCQEDVGAELIDNKCLIKCYACGSYDNNEWPTSTVEQCNTLGAINTHTTYCQYGCAITTSYLDDEISFMARGCKSNKPCPDDGTEECMIFGQNKLCTKCCMSKPLCNGDCSHLSLSTNGVICKLFLLSPFILTNVFIQY